MAHDTNRKVPATYARSAPDGFVAFGVSLPAGVLALLVDEPLLDLLPLPRTVAMGVPVGMSEDGTAEIGLGAGLPAGGGQNVSV